MSDLLIPIDNNQYSSNNSRISFMDSEINSSNLLDKPSKNKIIQPENSSNISVLQK